MAHSLSVPNMLPSFFRLRLQWALHSYDDLILDLQRRAYEQALRMVSSRRTVIQTVARELCENRWVVGGSHWPAPFGTFVSRWFACGVWSCDGLAGGSGDLRQRAVESRVL